MVDEENNSSLNVLNKPTSETPEVDLYNRLNEHDEDAIETMINYSTQLFLEDEDDNFEEDDAKYNSSWFDESFKDVTPKIDASTQTLDVSDERKRILEVEDKLAALKKENIYLENLLAVRDMDFARYLDLERKQRTRADMLEDRVEELKNQIFLNNEEDSVEEAFNSKCSLELVTLLLSDVLNDVVSKDTTKEDTENSIDDGNYQHTLPCHTDKVPLSSPCRRQGPFKEQILMLKKLKVSSGLCEAEETKLDTLMKASQEYLDVAPDSPDKTAAPLKVNKEPRKRKMPNEKNSILRRSERRAFGDQEDAPLKKKDKKDDDVDISLTYGAEEVPGSPMVYMVQEERTPIVSGKGLTLGQIWDVAIFNIDGRGLEGEPRVEVQGGRTRTVLQEDKEEAGLYIVKYFPEEVGYTAIHMFWNNMEIPGSPFQARICDSTAVKPMGGWEVVLDLGTGRMEMTVGEERLITWDVSKAGPGSMDIEIQGPVYDHRLDNAGPEKIKFVFIPRKEGTFTLVTKWNGALVRTVQAVVRPSPSQQLRTKSWDGQSLTASMKYSELEIQSIYNLSRTSNPFFVSEPTLNRLVIWKNPALMGALVTQDDPHLVLKYWNLTSDSYEGVTGEALDLNVGRSDEKEEAAEASKNKLGRDQPKTLLKLSNSKSFYQLINTMYNKILQFSTEVPEFSTFDWLNADLRQVDFAVKILLEWLQPLKSSSSMGDRTTTGTNKVYKTGLQNLFKFALKRRDVELSRQSCSMSLSMMAYKGKQAAYADSGQLVPEGSRERKPILDEDQQLRDEWLTKPLNQLETPEDLTLTVAAIIGDQACFRGVKVLQDIGRSAFKINLFDENGKEFVQITQAIRRKKDQGYANRPYRPFDKKVTGDHEVQAIKLLLSKLPPLGCQFCQNSFDLTKCACDEWMLRSLPVESWSFCDQVWFARQPWSFWKISKVNSVISKRAKLSKTYTNSSARPTGITNLSRANYSSAEISTVSEHIDFNTLEKYKKMSHLTQAADRHRAGLILAPSGRELLRGKANKFGKIGVKQDSIYSGISAAAQPDDQPKVTNGVPDLHAESSLTSVAKSVFKKPNLPTPGVNDSLNISNTSVDFSKVPFKVNETVFAKLRGFPYWPATVTRIGYDHTNQKFLFSVQFPNLQTGITDVAHVMKMNMENYKKLLNQRFKKSGYEVKSNFASDVVKLKEV